MKSLPGLVLRLPLSVPSSFKLLPNTATRCVGTSCSRENQSLPLPDGRVLGYAEYGLETGYPLMFFHGFPSSRLEAHGADEIACRRQLRVIAPDRPGFGLSTFQAHRRITDWPADVKALATHLCLSRFAVLGGSGGGPYALACAVKLPHEMLSAVGVLAGAPPWEAGTQHVPRSSRAAASAARYWPAGLAGMMNALVGLLRVGLTTRPATKRIDDWLSKAEPGEAGTPSMEEKRERLLRTLFEGFAQGSEAFVQEAQLLTQDWGFRFEDVAYDRVQLWHGTLDKNAPVQMIRYMVERLPYTEFREYEGESHWTLHRHIEEILSDLVPEAKPLGTTTKT